MRTQHGHYSAQFIEPYVDEEIYWAVKHHSALRFRADKKLGYEYPAAYLENFGEDYEPEDFIKEEWEYCANHKYYESAMQVCLNDLYAFDMSKKNLRIEDFDDVIAKEFNTPKEGLGFDKSPVAHMWRSLIWPNNFL